MRSYKAFPARVLSRFSLAALCGCLVNLWSVHTCALRAFTRSKSVRALRPLVPRPQRRTASFSGPTDNTIFPFDAVYRLARKFHALKSKENFREIFFSRTERRAMIPSSVFYLGDCSGNAICSDTARPTTMFPHRPATPR